MGNKTKNVLSLRNLTFLAIYIGALALLSACGTMSSSSSMELPSAYEIPPEGKLPIDGTWELQFQSSVGPVFMIEGRRMYVYANYGSRAWHGMVVAKNIRQISPVKYGCEYASVDKDSGKASFGRGEIEVLSEESILVRYFPKSETGHEEMLIDTYLKMRLDNRAWYLSELSRGKR
jgi:hypothetical protein